ncbi:hypothetical protein TrRE_jg335 [Triparma retinervis]|uniref:Thymus-specific serine protease n=1 Tax=Triparma retinervis TaxID=2557542 RepID=A0A9W6ZR54_9STRA|nr:hypothetical protein TrRE_jg335 [Triparma retinervis]
MVSAFSRLTYPSQINGAVSSSSPVQGAVSMPSYNAVVGLALKMAAVGGTEECLSTVTVGHQQIGEMLETETGRNTLAERFDVCGGGEGLEKDRDREVFAGDGVVYIPAQDNDPSCTGELCNIEKICEFLKGREEGGEEEWEVLARLASKQNGGQCVDCDWEERIRLLKSSAAVLGGTKSWMYQTCTGWGFYQTCPEASECPYSRGYHEVDQDLEMCSRVFNVTPSDVYKGVEDSNERYGGWDLEDERILFANGDVDPWSALSVTPDNAEIKEGTCKERSFWVEGASHHFWTHEILDTDKEEVGEARETIWETVIGWIQEDKDKGGGGGV